VAKHGAESLKKRIEDLSVSAQVNGNRYSSAEMNTSPNKGELEKWKAKYVRAAAGKSDKERQESELKAGLEAETTRGRRYKTEMGIKTINLKALLEIQKIEMYQYEGDLQAEKTKEEEAKSEFKQI